MSLTQQIVLRVPALLLGIIIIISSVLLAIAGLLIVRKFIPHQRLKLHNDVAGFIFATLGVIYAVLLAFVVVIVWESYDKADSNVEEEANCLIDLYVDSQVFPEEFRQELHSALTKYSEIMVNEEWGTLAMGNQSQNAKNVMIKIWTLYSNFEPKTESQKSFYNESISKLNRFGELRRLRLMESRSGVHTLLWIALILGGIVTIFFTFLFGTENVGAQIAMTSLLTILISLSIFIILELDFPFTGDISIKPEIFKQILKAIADK